MPRATNAPASRARRKKYLKDAAGYRGGRRRLMKTARDAVHHAGVYAYRDRKTRKRDFRQLWIARINAAAREAGLSYSQFMHGLRLAGFDLNRKVLADIAATDPSRFQDLVNTVKSKLEAAA